MPKFSIIIPVRKVNDYLKENLENLSKLDFSNFEVIVVVDEEDSYFLWDKRFRYVVSGKVGPGEKRNIGAKNSDGQILAFLDDDAFPKTDWLTKANIIFDEPDIYALCGPAVTPKNADFLERMSGHVLCSYMVSGPTTFRHTPKKRMFVKDYPTVNLFVKKKNFIEIGGFITKFWPGEDTKLCLDLIKKNVMQILYTPELIVFHHRRRVIIPHLKQISRYGRHRGQFSKLFPETSNIISYYIPSLFVTGLFLGFFAIRFFGFLSFYYYNFIFLYLVLLFIESIKIVLKEKNLEAFTYSAITIFLTHLVYGLSFIIGLFHKPKLELRDVDDTSGNYLGG